MAITKVSRGLLDTGVSDSSDATAITIDSSENVGIGTTSGDVRSDGNANRTYVSIIGNANRGVLNLGSTASAGADGVKLTFVNGTNAVGEIYVDPDSGSQTNGFMVFSTSNSERMRIDSSGRVGIGTTSPGYLLHVNDSASGGTSFQFQGNGPNLYTAMTNTSATSFIGVNGTQWEFYCGGTLKFQINTTNGGQTVSDQKFKKDIEDISYGLDTVKALQPRKFKWKENDESTIGFIAQEVKPVISEIITEPLQSPEGLENGMTLNYSALTAVLTKAIQEQQEQIEALQSEINTLKGGE